MGIITTIQRMSLHDGPGIRSTLFLKGCNFRCAWCHNPETWSNKPQLQFIASKCCACAQCINTCLRGAITLSEGIPSVNRLLCSNCGACAETCQGSALSIVGRELDARTVAEELLIDKPFFDESGGGITISGGEALLQLDFLKETLHLCHTAGVHTALETNLSWSWSNIEQLLPLVDLWMVDLKTIDTKKHLQFIKATNEGVLQNITKLCSTATNVIIRTPVIPQFNDTLGDIKSICDAISGLDFVKYELLPYHKFGIDKFRQLGIPCLMPHDLELDQTRFDELNAYVKKRFKY